MYKRYLFLAAIVSILTGISLFILVSTNNRYRNISATLSAITYKNEANAIAIFKSSKDNYSSISPDRLSPKKKNEKMLKWKKQRKLLKARLKALIKSDELSVPAKIGLTILCILLSIVSVYLLYILTLILALSDLIILSFVFFYGGLILIIILLYVMLKKIYRKKKAITEPENIPKEESKKPVVE